MRYAFVIIFILQTGSLFAQNANWFIGVWKGGAVTKKKSAQNIDISLTIAKVEGNDFEGEVRLTLISDTTIHSVSKVYGTIFHNYMSARIGENVEKKDPPGGKWETRCGACGAIQFIYTIINGRFVMTGEIKDCLPQCNGSSVYSRSLNEFDSVVRASMVALVNGEQDVAETKEDIPAKQIASTGEQATEAEMAYKPQPRESISTLPKKTLPETKYSFIVDASYATGVNVKKENITVYKSVERLALTIVSVPEKHRGYEKVEFLLNKKHAKGVNVITEPFITYHPLPKTSFTVVPIKHKPLPVIKRVITLAVFKAPIAVKIIPFKPPFISQQQNNTSVIVKKIFSTNPVKKPEAAIVKTQALKDSVAKKPIAKADSAFAKKQELVAVKPLPLVTKDSNIIAKKEVYEKRETNIIKAFPVNTDSVTLRLFDNGIVDGDTVSVFNNDAVVVSRLKLSSKAYEIKIAVDRNGENKIVMYAHNLGEIPPNTALMEIYSGKTMYSLLITSDLQKSSGILLKYKKE